MANRRGDRDAREKVVDVHPVPARRGVAPLLAVALAAALAAGPPASGDPAMAGRTRVSGGTAAARQPCPGPQPLVSGTRWHRHRLAPGVRLAEGRHDDRTVSGAPGVVDMHVLRIDLTKPTVTTRPLVDRIAERQPLSHLVAGHRHLVAATNTGFFDFYSGAPLGPVVDHGRPLVLGAARRPVLGFTRGGRAVATLAHLAGTVTAGATRLPVQAVNLLHPGLGVSVYTPKWGLGRPFGTVVPTPAGRSTVLRRVVAGRVRGTPSHSPRYAPHRGVLLVASTPASERWLAGLAKGTPVRLRLAARTGTKAPVASAYDVGKRLVVHGKPGPYLGCHERDTQAARTGVGFTRGGRQLIIVVVADHPCWVGSRCPSRQVHGLDHVEMAHLMIQLGASRAWEWDGSGSSELIARMPGSHRLSIRNYCADGEERPMPVGFGVFRRP